MENHWFNSVPKDSFNSNEVIGANLRDTVKSEKNSSVVLIGLNEKLSNIIRKNLFLLYSHFDNIELIDAGNVRNSNTEFLIPIIKEFRENGINIVFLGHENQKGRSITQAINKSNNTSNWAIASETISSEITSMPASLLEKYAFIGHQIHLIEPKVIELLNLKNIKKLSLGEYRTDYTEAEPFIRDLSAFILDINVTKGSELGSYKDSHPSGLTSEEVCQLARYAGLSEHCNIFSVLSNNESTWNSDTQAVKLIAQYIWYYLYGMNERREDRPDISENVIKYIVQPIDLSNPLTFLKSKKTGRWWLEIEKKEGLYKKEHISISKRDFEMAKTGNITDRILSAIQ